MSRFNWILTSYPTIAWINRQLDRRLTTGGKVVVFATLFFAVGSLHLDSPVYLLLASIMSLLFVALILSVYFRHRLTHQFELPAFAVVDETQDFHLKVTNARDRPAFDLQFYVGNKSRDFSSPATESQPGNLEAIESGQTKSIDIAFAAKRRGMLACPDVFCKTAYPFNLFHSRSVLAGQGQIAVVPAYHRLKSNSLLSRMTNDHSGDQNRSLAMADQEFIGSREYLPGIANRRWDYAAWARLGTPYVRQFEDEGHKNAIVVFDSAQTSPDSARFESAISLALSIVDDLYQNHFQLDALVVGDDCWQLAGESVANGWKKTCVALANVQPNPESQLASIKELPLRNQLVIIVSNQPDKRINNLYEELDMAGCRCEVLSVSDREGSDERCRFISQDAISTGGVLL